MKNYTVLIVEDSIVVSKFLKLVFKNAGFKIKTASDGYEALEKVIKDDINLIVSDLNMPDMDGITLLKNIKENSGISNIPVILISSNMPDNNELKGSYAFLRKPFNEEDIIKIAKRAVKEISG